ncbi:MAG: cell wall hydrolase, partial [Phenylobacterium sp.]
MSAVLLGASLGVALGATYLVGLRAGASDAPPEPGLTLAALPQVVDAGQAPALRPENLAQDLARPVRDGERPAVAGRDLDCLTQAVYYEARGEGRAGMQAVAQVVLNRARHPAFPKTICGVVFQGASRQTGCQFSFTCNGA